MSPRPPRGIRPFLQRFSLWLLLGVAVGIVTGSACALFLFALEKATHFRTHAGLIGGQPWTLFLLPVIGAAVGWLYTRFGGNSERGNNLIIEEIHQPGGGVPARMAPLVMVGTVAAHLAGASVGREGTAVQMGGSIAGALARKLRFLKQEDVRVLLMIGVAAGFGGVFGTPVAGGIFALEVLTHGSVKRHLLAPFEWLLRRDRRGATFDSLKYHALIPCLLAAWVSDGVCKDWGIRHTDYTLLMDGIPPLGAGLLLKVMAAGLFFGLAGAAFAEMTHAIKKGFEKITPHSWLRPAMGGLTVIGLAYLAGTRDYLGLGVDSADPHATTIVSCFFAGGAVLLAFAWKLLFTSVSVGSGLKGGEVTPLFFIGAALGNSLATVNNAFCPSGRGRLLAWQPVSVPLFAALGFVGVFAGATNTPLACTLMAVELFGPAQAPAFALACFAAYFLSGKNAIYTAQKH